MISKERWAQLAFGSNQNRQLLRETVNQASRNMGLQGAIKGKFDQYVAMQSVGANIPSNWIAIGCTRSSSGADTLYGEIDNGQIVKLYEVEVKGNSGSSTTTPGSSKLKISGSGPSYGKTGASGNSGPALKRVMASLVSSSATGNTHTVSWSGASPLSNGALSAAGWNQMALTQGFVQSIQNGAITNFTLDANSPANDKKIDVANSPGAGLDIFVIGFCSVIGGSVYGIAFAAHGGDTGFTVPQKVKIGLFNPATGGLNQMSYIQPANAQGQVTSVAAASSMTRQQFQTFRGPALAKVGFGATTQPSWNSSANSLCSAWATTYAADIVTAAGHCGITVSATPTGAETKDLLIWMSSAVLKGQANNLIPGFSQMVQKASTLIGSGGGVTTNNCCTVFTTCILDGIHGVPYIAGNTSKNNRAANYAACFKRGLDWINRQGANVGSKVITP